MKTKSQIPNPKSQQGFTLIEMVISGGVAALILTASYLCLNAAIAGQKMIEPRAEVIQNARVAMAMIAADLRVACPLSKEFEFLGMSRMLGDLQADNLDFGTHHYLPKRAGEGDFCQLSYFAEKEEGSADLTLYRRRNPVVAIDPLSGGTRELIARGLQRVQYEYYDGFDWYDSWGETDPKKKDQQSVQIAPNLAGMPEAVRITLWMNPNPGKKSKPDPDKTVAEEPAPQSPLVFQTVVRLNLAAASQSGFSRDSTTQTSEKGAQQQNPATGVINN